MPMTIQEDERFKAAMHGLAIGCLLPIFGYNLRVRNYFNIVVYMAVLVFEVSNVAEHCRRGSRRFP